MWARLGEWSASVGSAWRHDRDLQQGTLSRVGECICPRTDCVVGLYKREKKQELRTKSSLDSGRRWAGIPRRDLRLVADTHLDAAADAFLEADVEETVRPDCVVTSPPYKHAFATLKQAMRVGRMGVALKLRLTFLEPTKTRGRWPNENAPDRIVMIPRATYRGRECSSTEAWFIWETGRGGEQGRKPAICISLPHGAL